MALVAYSDSEHSSDDEAPSKPSAAPLPTSSSTGTTKSKPGFQKVVDSSNPHKIRVNLPKASDNDTTTDEADERASKRQRRAGGGGGAFSGFNSFLPAPKRTGQAAAAEGAGAGLGRGKGRGLGAGVSLKTGATPGFSREPEPEREEYMPAREDETSKEEHQGWDDTLTPSDAPTDVIPVPIEEKKPVKSTIFKPLSVARKPQKKRPTPSIPSPNTPSNDSSASQPQPAPPKPSLFSLTAEPTTSTSSAAPPTTTYEPLLYAPNPDPDVLEEEDDAPLLSDPSFSPPPAATTNNIKTAPQPQASTSLSDLATDLNLSRSAKRQLLGRNGTTSSTEATVLQFDTDKEYAANNILRRTADAAPVQPVRAIAPGKHSLKQLVNAASGQKEALEESFASGRRNRKEAGSRYGW